MIPLPETWFGKTPSAEWYYLAAADAKFFRLFARGLAVSAHQTGTPIHIHAINPDIIALGIADFCNSSFPTVSMTWCEDPIPATLEAGVGQARMAYYSNFRVHMWPHMLRRSGTKRVAVIDIDSIFNRPCDLMQYPEPIGIYRRDTQDMPKELMCCTSMFWADASQIDYAEAVLDFMNTRGLYWQGDQEAVYWTAKGMGLLDTACDISKLGALLDWEFVEKGTLWTGKGKRKGRDNAFTRRVQELTFQFEALRSSESPSKQLERHL